MNLREKITQNNMKNTFFPTAKSDYHAYSDTRFPNCLKPMKRLIKLENPIKLPKNAIREDEFSN